MVATSGECTFTTKLSILVKLCANRGTPKLLLNVGAVKRARVSLQPVEVRSEIALRRIPGKVSRLCGCELSKHLPLCGNAEARWVSTHASC